VSRPLRLSLAAALAAATTVAIGALSQVPWATEGAEVSAIRLSWRTRGEPVEECRKLTAEELEGVPVHMRREEVCEARIAPYRLKLTVDGGLIEESTVHASGAREDRPIYVYRELQVEPGQHRIQISFVPEADATSADRARHDRGRRASEHLGLDEVVDLEAGEVALVTYDPRQRVLEIRRGGPARRSGEGSGDGE